MRLIDLYYLAFSAFRKHTLDNPLSQKLRSVISHSNHQNESLTSIKYDCDIEIDWIENIEEGLIFVEKAIREDRQFIRTQGEVVPIEKVKRVSKASVEHLSRHSDLIKRVPKDDITSVIPDKLYIVEKLSDSLVYENRFLYMLLCYLKDFIQMRLDNIKDKTTTFQSQMTINKDIKANQRHLEYRLDYNDLHKSDPHLIDSYKKIPGVDRIENIYAMVVSFLATPLMREVSKAPLIKPPVVKTNVLRMNQNFRASLKLYDYVTSYTKDGYSFREDKKRFQPFPPKLADEIAETIELTSAIAYIAGNDMDEELQKEYELKEKELQELEKKKLLDDIKRLKKRIIEMNEDPAEYILKLERRNVHLEKESANLAVEQEKNAQLSITIESLEKDKLGLIETKHQLQTDIVNKINEIDVLNQKYFDDMTTAEEIHQQELSTLEANHIQLVNSLKASHAQTINLLNEAHKNEINDLKAVHEAKEKEMRHSHQVEKQALIDKHQIEQQTMIEKHQFEQKTLIDKYEMEYQTMTEQYESKIAGHLFNIKGLNENIDHLKSEIQTLISNHKKASEDYEHRIDTLEARLIRMDEEKKYVNAQFLAFKKQNGLMTEADDFTSKEKFKQLELEMIAYKKLFQEEWKKTRQKIRESVKKDTMVQTNSDKLDSHDVHQE